MAHNDEAGGSGYGGDTNMRSLQISYDEADMMYWQRIPVPLSFLWRKHPSVGLDGS